MFAPEEFADDLGDAAALLFQCLRTSRQISDVLNAIPQRLPSILSIRPTEVKRIRRSVGRSIILAHLSKYP